MPPKFGNAFSQQKEQAKQKQELNRSLEMSKSTASQTISKSTESEDGSLRDDSQSVSDSPRTTFDMFADLVPPVPESPNAKDGLLLSSAPRWTPRKQPGSHAKNSERSITDPTAHAYYPRSSAMPEPLFQSKQTLKSLERFVPKLSTAIKESSATPTPPTTSNKAIEILGGSTKSSAASKNSQESSKATRTPSKAPDPYRISCTSDDLRPTPPTGDPESSGQWRPGIQEDKYVDQKATTSKPLYIFRSSTSDTELSETRSSVPSLRNISPEHDEDNAENSSRRAQEKVGGIILGNPPLSPTIQGDYAMKGSAKLVNAMRIKSAAGVIVDSSPASSQADEMPSAKTVHHHNPAQPQHCQSYYRPPNLHAPLPPLPTVSRSPNVQTNTITYESNPSHSHFQTRNFPTVHYLSTIGMGPWENMHQQHPMTMPYYSNSAISSRPYGEVPRNTLSHTTDRESQDRNSSYGSSNSKAEDTQNSRAQSSIHSTSDSSKDSSWLPFAVPSLRGALADREVDQKSFDLDATPRKAMNREADFRTRPAMESTESVDIRIEPTPPPDPQTKYGGFAPIRKDGSYRPCPPIDQQIAYHFSLMQDYLHTELQKLNHHVEDSKNRILDEVLNHIEVHLTPSIQHSIQLAQETKSITEQNQKSLSALSKGMQSDVRALKALHADMIEQTRSESTNTRQMLKKHDTAVKRQVHETVADMVDEHLRPLHTALSVGDAPRRQTETALETDSVGSLLRPKQPPTFPGLEGLRTGTAGHDGHVHSKTGNGVTPLYPPAARAAPPPQSSPSTPTMPSRLRNPQRRAPAAGRGTGAARDDGGLLGGGWYSQAYGSEGGK